MTTLVLTPMVVDAVDIPVVTGGGIGDARGVLAALALGAEGIYMGTRFMATAESESHADVKAAIVRGRDACTVSVPKEHMLARDLANNFTREYIKLKASGATRQELDRYLDGHSQYRSQHLGEADGAEICCGQVAGLITGVQSAGDVINELVGTLGSRFEELKHKLDALL